MPNSPAGSGNPQPFRRGPRKERKPGTPDPRLTTHKARAGWFQARAAWPVREAPTHQLVSERARVRADLPPAPGTAQWQSVGPTNVGGRITSLACDPANPDRIWAGAAGGGVWHSTDAGATWASQWHSEEILNVGALAVHPGDGNTVYCGTGEANLSADSYPGVGLYVTHDGGSTWSLLASSQATGIPRRIGVIAIDPADPRHIRIGGVGHQSGDRNNPQDIGGMYVSRDGGATWRRETFISKNNYWCHSIVFHPTVPGTLYATFTEQGTRSGIWRSTNGGQSWTQLTSGLPPPARFGRTTLAISRSNPKVLYAFASDEASGQSDTLLGVFVTRNGGTTWRLISGTHFAEEGQISYGNTIAVHPTNPNWVLCGGVDLHLTTDGGITWTQVTHWDHDRGDPDYAHADHHALLMPAGAPGRVYDGNDGGVDLSMDGGRTWTSRSSGLAATMFYDVDVAQSDGRVFGGGTQDNGTNVTVNGQAGSFSEILGGDGGWMVFDPTNPRHLFASYYNFNIYRFRPTGPPVNVSPPAGKDEKGSVWMCYIAMLPSNPRTVYTASVRVWKTVNDGTTWTPVSPVLDRSPVSAIELAVADPRVVYVGTENGAFFRSRDAGKNWSPNLASATLPGTTITRIVSSPTDANLVFACVANFGNSHVFRSADGGNHWEDIDRGQLPDVPHHAILVDPNHPTTVYTGNDVGVFVSRDNGNTWEDYTRNLPNVMVIDLVCHSADKTLTAATYGRSLWRIAM